MDNQSEKLYGLVLTGGQSSRMKQDKAALKFHGVSQSQYAYDLLMPFCGKIFISNRKEQENDPGHKGFEQIHDEPPFINIGPLGGIMTAMTKYPGRNWLVLACDLPFLNTIVIEHLLSRRNSQKIATAYRSTHDGLPEPLCAIYEYYSLPVLRDFCDRGIVCPRKIMINSDVELITQMEDRSLDNINTLDEYNEALRKLDKKK